MLGWDHVSELFLRNLTMFNIATQDLTLRIRRHCALSEKLENKGEFHNNVRFFCPAMPAELSSVVSTLSVENLM